MAAPDWDSDVDSWAGSEGTSASELCEHNVESLALNVIGQNWLVRRKDFSLPGGMGACESGLELPHSS